MNGIKAPKVRAGCLSQCRAVENETSGITNYFFPEGLSLTINKYLLFDICYLLSDNSFR